MDLGLIEPALDEAGDSEPEPAAPLGDLPLVPVEPSGAPSVVELESLILEDPDNPELHLLLADRLLAGGEETRGLEELELALDGFERLGEWGRATDVAERLVALAPDTIRHHQKRVELAFRIGRARPAARCLSRPGRRAGAQGATDKALAVYGRVHEHDPENAHAIAALAKLQQGPEPAPPPPPSAPAVPAADSAPGGGRRPAAAAPAPRPSRGLGFVRGSGLDDLRGELARATRACASTGRTRRSRTSSRNSRRSWSSSSAASSRTSTPRTTRPTMTWASPSRRWGCWTRRSRSSRRRSARPRGGSALRRRSASASSTRASIAISETVLRRAVDTVDGGDDAKIGLLYWLGRAARGPGEGAGGDHQLRAGPRRGHPVHGPERPHASTRRGPAQVSSQTAPVSLADIQRPLRARLERVQQELRRIVEADFGLIAEVNAHLFQMQGKMFRPTLAAPGRRGHRRPRPARRSPWPRWSS